MFMHDTALQLMVAQLNYIAAVILFLLLFASYYFTQEKKYDYHQKMIRYMVLVQTIITINMILSFFFTYYGSNFIIHAIMGTLIYLLIIYTFLYMERRLPKSLMIPKKHSKLLMRVTAGLWGVAIVTGLFSLMVIID